MVTHVPAPPGPRLCKVGLGAGQWELGLALGIKRKANLVNTGCVVGLLLGSLSWNHTQVLWTPTSSMPPPPMPPVLTCL